MSAAGRGARALVCALVAVAVVAMAAESGYAAFGIAGFDGAVNADADGSAYTQAGGHPFSVSTDIAFNTTTNPLLGVPIADGDPKTIRVDLPVGLIGNPAAVPACRADDFFRLTISRNGCPIDTQVGVATVQSADTPELQPLYSIEPPSRDVPAAFGFSLAGVPIVLHARVRTDSDYGITIVAPEINQGVPLTSTRIEIWGTPYAGIHDRYRCKRFVPVSGQQHCNPAHSAEESRPQSVSGSARAFMTLPTVCTAPGVGLETRLAVDSWQAPGVFHRASFMSHLPPGYPDAPGPEQGPENCGGLPFEPVVDLQPTSRAAGKPTGVNVDIDVPQAGLVNPGGLATAHLKKVEVTLPEGMSISPSAADGLQACTDAQVGFGNIEQPRCPVASKVGTVEIETPVLADSLRGDVYIGASKPGQIFRLLLFAQGGGVTLKLEGKVNPDPVTGRITTVFDDNPQLPFTKLRLSLKSGPRAPLSNPPACGTYETTARLTSWSGKVAETRSTFPVTRDGAGEMCPPQGFTPSFSAGLVNAKAGSSSSFILSFGRDDEDQTLQRITIDMPEGLTGVIAGPDLCAEPQASSGTCGEESRIGSTVTGAGSGTNPFYLPGRVYITEGYKGAPFGLSIVVPAVAGPFDLGTVVVRAGIRVDTRSAKLTVDADPLPRILAGVPLLIRDVRINIDRPGFMRAPTNCSAKQVAASVSSYEGSTAGIASRFAVAGCKSLPYKPRLTFRIGDRRHVRGRLTTPFEATLRMPEGTQANNRKIVVTLPENLNSRLNVLRGACTVEEAAQRNCKAEAIVGEAMAVTPLLRDPLVGPVYIVRTVGNRLPNLWVALRGQGVASGVRIDLLGRVSIVGRKLLLRTTFDDVPDVPVTTFRMRLVAGRRAPVGLIRGICKRTVRKGLIAKLAMRGQNGDLLRVNQRMSVAGCGRSAVRRAARTRRRGRGRR